MTPAPALACAALEIALNRYLRLDDGALDACARLQGRSIAVAVEDLGWEWHIEPTSTGVRVTGTGDADVRIDASSWRLLRAGLPAGVLDAGLDGRPLAQVDRVAQQVRPGPQGDLAGAVGAAIVHTDDVVEHRSQVGNDLADDRGFVEGRDDDPDVGVVRLSGHLCPPG